MKRTYLLSIILFALFFPIKGIAQTLPSIQLDRPDQTECPFIVPKNYIQIEHGFTLENINSKNTIYSYPSSLIKFGLNEKFEFRLIAEIQTQKFDTIKNTGLTPITVGFKTNICEENGIIPRTSFIGHLTTADIGSSAFHTRYIAPSFRFTMQHTISDRIVLAYNLGAEWNGVSAMQTYIYTLTTGFTITEKLGAYIELYGFAPKDFSAQHLCDGGLTYLINDDFILDLSASKGITSNASDNYVSLGVSYRFKVRD